MTAIGTIIPDPDARSFAAGQQTAAIIDLAPGGVRIAHRGVVTFARVALSCLVRPEPGDHVLIADADALWVIAVLDRPSGGPLRLLDGRDAVIAGGALTLAPGVLNIHAKRANLFIEEVIHAGASLTAHVASIKLFGGLIETLAERVMLQARRCMRILEESDHLRAGTIDHAASGSLHVQAQNAFFIAEQALRMDADQIHMG